MNRTNSISQLAQEKSLYRFVQANLKSEFPQLYSQSRLQALRAFLYQFLMAPVFWALILFGILAFINEAAVSRNIIFGFYMLDAGDAGEILTSFVDTVVASIGILIPLIILLLEFLGRNSRLLIDIHFRRTRIIPAAVTALVIAAVLVIVKFYLLSSAPASSIDRDKVNFYLVLLTLLLTGAVLTTIVLSLRRIQGSLSSESSLNYILESLQQQIRESQRQQLTFRYCRIAQTNFGEKLGLQRLLLPGKPAHFSTVPLGAPKTGYIVDINPAAWVRLQDLFTSADTEEPIKGFVAKLIGDYVSKGDVIVHAILAEPRGVWKWQWLLTWRLRHALAKCVKISNVQPQLEESIDRLLDHLKVAAQASIKETNDVSFEQYLAAYRSILQLGIELPSPPSDSPIPNPFSDWYATNIVLVHLRQIVEVAAQAPDERYIKLLIRELKELIRKAIQQSHQHVPASLQQILFLFDASYLFASQNNKQASMRAAYASLVELIHRDWPEVYGQHYSSKIALDNLKQALMLILDMLGHHTMKAMVDMGDMAGVEELLHMLSPEELQSGHRHMLADIKREIMELQWDIAANRIGPEAEAEMGARIEALNVWEHAYKYFHELVFVVGSYVTAAYNHDEIDIARMQRFWQILEPYYRPFEESIHTFTDLVQWQYESWYRYRRQSSLWHAYVTSDEGKYYLFFCIRGFLTVKSGNVLIPQKIGGSYSLEQISATCDAIAQHPEKWHSFLGDMPRLDVLANRFVLLNRVILQTWHQAEVNRILDADLDKEQVALLQDAATRAWETTPSLRGFLAAHGALEADKPLEQAQIISHEDTIPYKKELAGLSEGSDRLIHEGSKAGKALLSQENRYIVYQLQRSAKILPDLIHEPTLHPYAEKAIGQLVATGYTPHLILVPDDINHMFLFDSPDFEDTNALANVQQLPYLKGCYNGIPVLMVPSIIGANVIVLDVERTCRLMVWDFKIDLFAVSPDEFRRILENTPGVNEQLVAQSVRIRLSEKVRLDIRCTESMVKVPVSSAPEIWPLRRHDLFDE